MDGATTTAETPRIAVNDLVRHGLSGPGMLVTLIDTNEAVCEWSEEGQPSERRSGIYPVSELTLLHRAGLPTTNDPAAATGAGESNVVLAADDGEMPWPREVLLAFVGWLTTRDEIAGPFSRIHEASQAAVLVDRFSKSQGYAPPRDDFTSRFQPYPQD